MHSETTDGGERRAAIATPGNAAWDRSTIGQVVRSVRGRDAGRWYLVVEKGSDGFYYVADGSKRTVQRPKRKNPKHLLVYDAVAERVAGRLTAGRRVNDEEVHTTLMEFARLLDDHGEEVDDTGEARCDRG